MRMFNVLFSIMGIKVIKRHTEHLESNKNYVIVCNHQSSLDVIGEPVNRLNYHQVYDQVDRR